MPTCSAPRPPASWVCSCKRESSTRASYCGKVRGPARPRHRRNRSVTRAPKDATSGLAPTISSGKLGGLCLLVLCVGILGAFARALNLAAFLFWGGEQLDEIDE